MIFHTIHTITISRFSEMLDSGNNSLMYRVPVFLPKYFKNKAASKLTLQYNQMVSAKRIRELMEDAVHSRSMKIRIEKLYPSMFQSMSIYLQWDETPNAEIVQLFVDHFGVVPKTLDELAIVSRKIKSLKTKYRQMYAKVENTDIPDDKQNFEAMLIGLEIILPQNIKIERSMKLFQLKNYIERASEIIKKQENG